MVKPLKYLTDIEIEERAAQVLDRFVTGGRELMELPIDIDTILEADYGIRVVWEPIDEPEGCRTFAFIEPFWFNGDWSAKITLNELHQKFLFEHPEIERLTRAHELCHWEVHIDKGSLSSELLPFDTPAAERKFHRINYSENAPTPEQKNRLAKFAFKNSQAYTLLKPREANCDEIIEPAWMHRQAEHFAACLLVPRKPLFNALESGIDPTFYGTHVQLAEKFQVSKRVIQIRLKKLHIIEEYERGKFRLPVATENLSFKR
jgi:hypothetical protein